MTAATSILAGFAALRDTEPDRPLFTFVDDQGRDRQTLTAAGLAGSAGTVAATLRAAGLRAGERAVLVYPPGPDFVTALVGCLIAGVVPVPVYPPDPLRADSRLAGFAAVVADCGAQAALTNGEYERARTLAAVKEAFGARRRRWPAVTWLRTDRGHRPGGPPPDWHRPAGPDEVALLQYTSGSTGVPRGVMITHRNLTAELAANARDLGLGADARGVSWLPQYHDFGLISVILSALAGNAHAHLLSPLAFLHRPGVWFDVLSRVRATHTAAPNFAFDVAVRRTTPAERAGWDLRRLRVLMCAAEPIRAATVDAFLDAFEPAGLSRGAFYPAYGLAEHTVSVTMGGRGRLRLSRSALADGRVEPAGPDEPSLVGVGCGRVTKPGARLRIVDPGTGRPCPPDRVGEIWTSSETKAAGYHGRPGETAEVFEATVTGDDDPTRYLRTGDLGFLHDGELYIAGRHRDLVIVHGSNFFSQDLEDSVRDCDPAVRPGGVAVFSDVDTAGREQVVVFVEVRDRRTDRLLADRVARAARRRLHAEHGVAGDAVVVVGPRGLVRKTTSGKVRRSACRQAWRTGALDGAVVAGRPAGERR